MKKLPHNPTVRHHAWSDDPERDRRVRLAEDGRTEPGPTLEEAIAAVWKHGWRTFYGTEAVREGDEYLLIVNGREEWWPADGFVGLKVRFFVRRRVTNTGGER